MLLGTDFIEFVGNEDTNAASRREGTGYRGPSI
jgi:hypothetical protein